MVSPGGRKLHFHGYKLVNSKSFLNPFAVWRQTTTLYVTITDTTNDDVVGRGTLQVQQSNFVQELMTFNTSGPSIWSRLMSTTRFFSYFGRHLAAPFFSTLGRLNWPVKITATIGIETTPSETYNLTATDGEKSILHMWNPIKDGQEVLGPAPTMLFVPGAAVDHTIYALPTIKRNAITYFREAGYRAYCLVHRVGRTPAAKKGYTPFDARLDIHAALVHIRRSIGNNKKVYVVAHCAGSVAFCCGLLDGTIPGEWLCGITSSQVFMHPKFGKVNSITSRVPMSVYEKVVGPWWDCNSSPDDTYVQRLLNQLLRFYPVRSGETCKSVVCHRGELVFGRYVNSCHCRRFSIRGFAFTNNTNDYRLWNHRNLTEATHRHLDRFLFGVSLKTMGWLTNAGRVGHVTTNEPANENLVTPENIERLKGIPILFIAGSDNVVFVPENTDTTFTTLCRAHGKQWYEREVFMGLGHLDTWMGQDTYKNVYPRVEKHVNAVMKKEEGKSLGSI